MLSPNHGQAVQELLDLHVAGTARHREHLTTGDLRALEDAIATLTEATRLATEIGQHTARMQIALGNALMSRVAARGEGIEETVRCFALAWELGSDDDGETVGALHGLTGSLVLRDGPGDLEQAIGLYEAVQGLLDERSMAAGALAAGLGKALLEWFRRTRDMGALDRAVHVLEAVTEQPASAAVELATAVLAEVHLYRYDSFDNSSDLLEAVKLSEELFAGSAPFAPERLHQGKMLMIAYNKVHLLLMDGSYLDRAIEIGEQLLTEVEPGPPRRELQQALGTFLMNRGGGHDPAQLDQAAALLQEALGDPPEADGLLYLAGTHLSRYWLTDDVAALEQAHAATTRLLRVLSAGFGRVDLLDHLRHDRDNHGHFDIATTVILTRAAADPAAARELYREAMVAAELGKSRLLTEQVGRAGLPPPAEVPAGLAERERVLIEYLVDRDTADLAAFGNLSSPPLLSGAGRVAAAAARDELGALWSEIEQLGDRPHEWVELRRGDPLDWDDLRLLATPGSALVSLVELHRGLVALVLPHGAAAPIAVDTGISRAALTECVELLHRETASSDSAPGETWYQTLVPMLREVARHLRGVYRMTISPDAASWLVPWSVVAHHADLRTPDGDPMPLVTVPAFGALRALRQRRPPAPARTVLVVGDPLGDLPAARAEARAVADQHGTDALIGQRASSAEVLSRLRTADVLHLATHAHFDRHSPLDSGIVLADRVLPAREVIAAETCADLVVLSACETGRADSIGGNEMAGLGQAFLQAGARAVVVSLWTVHDKATRALMHEFYARLAAGDDTALALARATPPVRTRPRWAHTRFWGPFMIIGDAVPGPRG